MGWIWIASFASIVGVGSHLGAKHALRQPPGWPRALAAGVLAWGWVTVSLQVLGGIGLLDRAGMFVTAGLGLAAALLSKVKWPAPPDPPKSAASPAGTATAIALGLVILSAMMIGIPSLLGPPKIVSDGPIYHLYFAARWWKAGRIFRIAFPFGESAATYFPANGDLWFSGLMTLYGGDRPARVGQSPFLILAGASCFAIARRFGAKAPAAMVATAWFLTSLPLFLFGFEANVDAFFVAGYLATIYFGLRHALDSGGAPALVLAGLAAGLAWGTKATSSAFIPPLLILGGVIVWTRPLPRRDRAVHLIILGVFALVPCGFWFARSLLATGNPFYPMHMEVLGRVILRGWYRTSAMSRSQFHLPVGDWRSLISILFTVFDPRLAPFWLAALCGAWQVGKTRSPRDRWVWGLAGLAIGNVAIYWLAIPYRTQQRFMLQAVGLAAIPLALTLERSRVLLWGALALLAIHLSTVQSWPIGRPGERAPWELSNRVPMVGGALLDVDLSPATLGEIVSQSGGWEALAILAGVTGSSFLLGWLWSRTGPGGSRLGGVIALAATLAVALGYALAIDDEGRLSHRIFPRFPPYDRGWEALEALSPPMGTRVAYAGTNLPVLLMAGGLRNDVVYVNIDAHRDWLLHDYHLSAREWGDPDPWVAPDSGPLDGPRPGWDRIHPEYRAWLANLEAEGVGLLVVAKANPSDGRYNLADVEHFPIERVWADAHPESFSLAYPRDGIDPEMRIYRVHPEKNEIIRRIGGRASPNKERATSRRGAPPPLRGP